MNLSLVERIAGAVLYEGYILYPYRASTVKNRLRFNFGVLYPEAYSSAQTGSDASSMQTECLLLAGPGSALYVRFRFLHLLSRQVASLPDLRFVESLRLGSRLFQSWQEAVEREVHAPTLYLDGSSPASRKFSFSFPSSQESHPLSDEDGQAAGVILRKQEQIEGEIELAARQLEGRLFKITARISNLTLLEGAELESRDRALMRSMVSTHTILTACGGEFLSLLEPDESFAGAASDCRNIGTWPVLVGENRERNVMLSSPIILYDYPQVAPESAGDLFDATEIDEILTLRIMTLTDEEKREMSQVDERARRILERTERLAEDRIMKLHGEMRKSGCLKQGER